MNRSSGVPHFYQVSEWLIKTRQQIKRDYTSSNTGLLCDYDAMTALVGCIGELQKYFPTSELEPDRFQNLDDMVTYIIKAVITPTKKVQELVVLASTVTQDGTSISLGSSNSNNCVYSQPMTVDDYTLEFTRAWNLVRLLQPDQNDVNELSLVERYIYGLTCF